eukprot:1157834-Pelagomonas_calceolata.AAC.14
MALMSENSSQLKEHSKQLPQKLVVFVQDNATALTRVYPPARWQTFCCKMQDTVPCFQVKKRKERLRLPSPAACIKFKFQVKRERTLCVSWRLHSKQLWLFPKLPSLPCTLCRAHSSTLFHAHSSYTYLAQGTALFEGVAISPPFVEN